MNTINLHDSFASYDAPPPAPPPPDAPPSAAHLEPVAAEAKSPAALVFDDAAVDDALWSPVAPSGPDVAALDEPLVAKSIFDWVGSMLTLAHNALARFLTAPRGISLRLPKFSAALDAGNRVRDENRRDVQKAEQKKKLVAHAPVNLTTEQYRSQRLVGDKLIIEITTIEKQTQTAVNAVGRVISKVEDTKVDVTRRDA